MSWQPVTIEELKGLGNRIDTAWIVADSVENLHIQLNAHGSDHWTMITGPKWVGDKLVALIIRPRTE